MEVPIDSVSVEISPHLADNHHLVMPSHGKERNVPLFLFLEGHRPMGLGSPLL